MNINYDVDPSKKKKTNEPRQFSDWPIVVFLLGNFFIFCTSVVAIIWMSK